MTTIKRTVASGLAGGVAFAATNFLTFGLFGGARRGQTGLLFDPVSQGAKVIAVWKNIEPLPVMVTKPQIIAVSWLVLVMVHALVHRSMVRAIAARRTRIVLLALTLWLNAAFFELMGPFNLLHEPLKLMAIELTFWALASTTAAMTIVMISDRGAIDGTTSAR